jgi:transposase-like protein
MMLEEGVVKTVECDECDGSIVVWGDFADDFQDWLCNDCDKKNNPEDYEN